MKASTNTKTTHTIGLEEQERFQLEGLTSRPLTIQVQRVYAHQDTPDGRWYIWALGPRILKTGKFGKTEKMDTWSWARSFRADVDRELFNELSHDVRAKLTELGVTF